MTLSSYHIFSLGFLFLWLSMIIAYQLYLCIEEAHLKPEGEKYVRFRKAVEGKMVSYLILPFVLKERKMEPLPTKPTTAAAATSACALLQMCHQVKEVTQLHAYLVVSGALEQPVCAKRLLESYVRMSEVWCALSIFKRVPTSDVFAYNTMMRGLIMGKFPNDSLLLYNELLLGCLTPDNYTYTFVLKACAHLTAVSEGKQVHCRMIKSGVALGTHTHSSLIHMYSSSGSIDDAERVFRGFSEENTLATNSMISGYLSEGLVDQGRAMFDSLASKDVASWSAMVTGYVKNGMYEEALALFSRMHCEANESTLVSLLSACAHIGALDQGRWIHGYIDKNRVMMSTKLSTALIDMYAKCGSIECGYELFRKMNRRKRDIVTWGVMISGFSTYGQARKCSELFEKMVADGFHPNEVIFVSILSACSHAGSVEEGRHYFSRMVHEFGIRPCIEHYGCMVDLLARAGRVAEAEEMIMSMAERPNSVIWGAMLSGCRSHNDARRGRWAFRQLMELEPMSGDRYKQGELMFANGGEQEEAANLRKIMEEKGLETTRGSSFVEVEGTVHEFVVGDISHGQASEIYRVWKGVTY